MTIEEFVDHLRGNNLDVELGDLPWTLNLVGTGAKTPEIVAECKARKRELMQYLNRSKRTYPRACSMCCAELHMPGPYPQLVCPFLYCEER